MTAPVPDRRRAVPLAGALALLLAAASCLAADVPASVATAASATIAANPVMDLALNRPYTLNCDTLPGWDGLVDGVKNSDDPPDCFATDNSSKFPKSIVIDLGCPCDVSKIVVYNSPNGNTREILVGLSKDAKTYDTVRDYVFPDRKYQPLVHRFPPREARFVKLTFKDSWEDGLGGKYIIYLREVEVFGRRLAKLDTGGVWAYLATARTVLPSAAWPVSRRYLKELGRPTRLAVLTDADPNALLGPEGWLARSLADAGRSLGPNGLKLASYSTATDGEAAINSLEGTLDRDPPDVLLVVYSVDSDTPLRGGADHAIAACAKAGVAVIIVIPPPSKASEADPVKYRERHRRLLAVASGAGAMVIDGGAALARSAKPSALVTDTGLTHEGRALLSDALVAALAK